MPGHAPLDRFEVFLFADAVLAKLVVADAILGLVVAAVLALTMTMSGRRDQLTLVGVGLANVLLHLLMDSIAADIRWLYPFSDLRVNLVHVPAPYKPWYLNFLFHWTFVAELLIVLLATVAATLDWRRWRRRTVAVPATQ